MQHHKERSRIREFLGREERGRDSVEEVTQRQNEFIAAEAENEAEKTTGMKRTRIVIDFEMDVGEVSKEGATLAALPAQWKASDNVDLKRSRRSKSLRRVQALRW